MGPSEGLSDSVPVVRYFFSGGGGGGSVFINQTR